MQTVNYLLIYSPDLLLVEQNFDRVCEEAGFGTKKAIKDEQRRAGDLIYLIVIIFGYGAHEHGEELHLLSRRSDLLYDTVYIN